jgi:co-chaperonin GroES (HSP10)
MDKATRAAALKPLPPKETKPRGLIFRTLRPRGKWVLVKRLTQDEELSPEGTIIVDKSQRKSSVGRVIAAGIEVTDLFTGDEVLFSKFAMTLEDVEEQTGEKDLFLVRGEEIYSVLEPSEPNAH